METYNEYSVVPSIFNLVSYDEVGAPTRLKFAQRVTLEHWLEPGWVNDLVFNELGRTIGLSERIYVTDKVLSNVPPRRVDALSLDVVTQSIRNLVDNGHEPSAMLLPIEAFKEVHNVWNSSSRLISYHPETISVEGRDVRLFWSNKYNPFHFCYIVSRDCANWTARPSLDVRLTVDFVELEPRRMQVTVESRFDVSEIRADAVIALEIANLEPMEIGG